jgi:hypothetical protein
MSETTYKPIETFYNGYRFRSRLEARWAVFFDAVGLKYLYEHEGFDLDGDWYLPDFYLTDWDCYVEIKPIMPEWPHFGKKRGTVVGKRNIEFIRCQKLSEGINKIVLFIGGIPGYYDIDNGELSYEIAVFAPGPISIQESKKKPHVPFIDFSWRLTYYFFKYHLHPFMEGIYKCHPDFFNKPLPKPSDCKGLIEADKRYIKKKTGCDHPHWFYGNSSHGFYFCIKRKKIKIANGLDRFNESLDHAYDKARQARFEHGERS